MVAAELKVRLLLEEQKSIEKKETASSAAFMLYLKERYYWNERSKGGLIKAREYFEKAIGLDQDYARAYSGLADAYAILAFHNYVPSSEAQTQQKLLIEKALNLDSTLPEAHTSMGSLLGDIYDWRGAEREFGTALELTLYLSP